MMEIVNRFNKNYITWKDQYNRIPNVQIQIYSVSGGGKGLFAEGLVESWQSVTKGIVIWLVDPKKEVEGSFAMYEPKEIYHLNRLKSDGMIPEKKNVKLYHPFTFNIPKGFLPDINFYTIPIKKLSKEEFGILAETGFDSESVKVMMRAKDNLNKDEGLFAFLHEIQRMIKGRKQKKHQVPDPKNFLLSVGAGTSKSIVEASSYLSPFRNDYFLRKENCPNAIDWSKILTDNSCYHVFFTKWIAPYNDKIHGFVALSLLSQILRNIDYAKKPIMIVIPEVLFLCPEYAVGWSMFLGDAFQKAMITMRSKGRGVSSISDSQSWDNTSRKITGSGVITFFGKLNPTDLDRVCKARNYTRTNRELLMGLEKNQFVFADNEDYGSFRGFFPRHCHKEEEYNWIEIYKDYFPDKMKRYENLKNYMKKELKDEEKYIMNQIEKMKKKEEAEKNIEEKEKEIKSTKSKKLEGEIEKAKSKRNELEDAKRKLIIEWLNNPNVDKKEKSERKVSQKFKLGRYVVHKIFEEYKNKSIDEEELKTMIGEGVMQEEIESEVNHGEDIL